MADGFKYAVLGIEGLKAALRELAPEMRRGPARRALVKGAEPVLAKAIAETPMLAKDIYRKGHLYRSRGTLRRALRIRSSKDTNSTGDVGVFVNVKPLTKGAVSQFKSATGRKSSENAQDPFYWRFVHFATKKNKNPKPFLTRAGQILVSTSLPLISASLKNYFERLDKRKAAK